VLSEGFNLRWIGLTSFGSSSMLKTRTKVPDLGRARIVPELSPDGPSSRATETPALAQEP
jgi:hypothetical protein